MAIAVAFSTVAVAQNVSQAITLSEAVDAALRNYPSIRAAQAEVAIAGAATDLAGTQYLPRADLLWQQNIATRNNVFGLLFPQSTIPPISGPQLPSTSWGGAGGNAAGLLVSWEPFDFGLRKAGVEAARAMRVQSEAAAGLTRLDVASAAADAFLSVLAAEQAVRVARASVARMETFARTVQALVDNQLKPGVDASRARAELAAARNQLISAEERAEISRVALGEAIGSAGSLPSIDPGRLNAVAPPPPSVANDFALHPMTLTARAAVESAEARARVLDRSYYPRFNLQAAAFGRGSGALMNGDFDHSMGWYPNAGNWAVGITVTFSLMDIAGIRARHRMETANVAAERARQDHTLQGLKTEEAKARAQTEASRKLLENTPLELKAAQETETSARARYENGLTNVVEVADAQRLLAQAEFNDALARLSAWRALLALARVRGDLTPFIQLVARNP